MHSVSIKRFKAIGVTAIIVLMTFTWWVAKEVVGSDTKDDGFFGGSTHRLLTKEDRCTLGGVADPLNFTHPAAGILYFIGMMWTFVSMGQVCEDYFVSALNAMVHKWNISPGMAGATFMAAGTSMPEVFAALVGLFSSNGSDMGINTVVGSTVFNMVCIIGGSIIVYPGPGSIKLPPISLLRDSLFFITAVVLLYLTFRNPVVNLRDCISLLSIYCCYVVVCSLTPMIVEKTARPIDQGEEEILKPSVQNQLEEQLLLSPRARMYDGLGHPQLYSTKARKSSASLRSEVYSGVPHNKNVAQVYHTNYELMLRSRENVVSALFGLPEEDTEREILKIEPLRDTANAVGPDQLLSIETLFFEGSFVFHQQSGGDLQLAGKDHPIKKDLVMADIKKHSPGISHTDSHWSDLVEALNSYELRAISKTDFIPIYKTWYQCSRLLQLPLEIHPGDVEHVTKIFDRVVAPFTHFMTDEEVTSVFNQLTLSPVYKEELLRLLESTKPNGWGGKLTRSGCKALFVQWIVYARTRVSFMNIDTCAIAEVSGKKIEEEEIHTVSKMPESGLERVLYIIGLPMSTVLYLSVPDCRKPFFKNWFLLSMIVSMLWLVVLVYLMLNWAQKWGCLWGVSPPLMGMTVTAAGTSLPDFLASIAVSRAGEGQMSVTNAFGSNIFDSFLQIYVSNKEKERRTIVIPHFVHFFVGIGLGLPFALKTFITGEPVVLRVQGIFEAAVFLIGLQIVFVLIVSLYHKSVVAVVQYTSSRMFGIISFVAALYCWYIIGLKMGDYIMHIETKGYEV